MTAVTVAVAAVTLLTMAVITVITVVVRVLLPAVVVAVAAVVVVRVVVVAGHRGRLLNAWCGQGRMPCKEVNRRSDEDPKTAVVTVVVPLSGGSDRVLSP